MPLRTGLASLALVGCLHVPVEAASPDSWRDLEREVARRCIAASTLKNAKVKGNINFPDDSGQTVMLVTGTYGSGATAIPGTELCLFDRGTRRAVTTEAEGWSVKSTRP